MPLSPTPLLPGTSPLPIPGQRPPDSRAKRMGALVAIPLLVVLLAGGQLLLPRILFLAPGLQAQTGSTHQGQASSSAPFQGFTMRWLRRQGGGGYNTAASLDNMKFEAQTFHMNSVIIPVVADMLVRSESTIAWHPNDAHDKDTYSDDVYQQAIDDAKQAGLVPILELQVLQQDGNSATESPQYIGTIWSQLSHDQHIAGETDDIGTLERKWFNNYTRFAVHFAQLSQKNNLPYFIIGDQLTSVTEDTARTNAKYDPGGIERVPGESFPNCSGRRDCEWRHVIHALRSPTYAEFINHASSQPGGSYTGKLIYAAAPDGANDGMATTPEYNSITWWDAVDIIGVDAFFPLTQNADVGVNDLMNAWNGKGLDLEGAGDIVSNLSKVSGQYGKQVLFTAAGYMSAAGSNSNPLGATADGNGDQYEQLNDTEALLQTFAGTPFWDGVMWYADQPVTPRSKQSGYATNSYWGGDTLKTSKLAGQYLARYYSDNPLQ